MTPKMEVLVDLSRTPAARNDVKPRVKTIVLAVDGRAEQLQKVVKMITTQMSFFEQEMKIEYQLNVKLKTKVKTDKPPNWRMGTFTAGL